MAGGRGTGRRPRGYSLMPWNLIWAATMRVDHGCRAAASSSAGAVAGRRLPYTLAVNR